MKLAGPGAGPHGARSEAVLLPSRVASLYVLQGGLKALPLPVPLPDLDFQVQAQWHARHEYSAAHRWLVDEIVQTLGKL